MDATDSPPPAEQLPAEHSRLRLTIDSIPAMVWSDEVRRLGWQPAFHPDDLPAVIASWEATLANGPPVELEAPLRGAKGIYRWFLMGARHAVRVRPVTGSLASRPSLHPSRSILTRDLHAAAACPPARVDRAGNRRWDQVQALIVQNGNAYDEGLREFWDPIKRYWADPRPEHRTALHSFVEPKTTRWQYENGVADRTLLGPTTWLVDQVGLDREGNREIQMDLFYDYRTNVPLYPDFQAFFRQYQPPTLIVWGKNDFIFPPEGAAPYCRDLRTVETHLLDTGHFALETHGDQIASHIEAFLARHVVAR